MLVDSAIASAAFGNIWPQDARECRITILSHKPENALHLEGNSMHPLMPRVGWSVDGFTEEHPAKAVLLGPVGLVFPCRA